MKKNVIDELAIKMLVEGEQWDQELSAIIESMDNLDLRDRDGRTLLMNCCAYHFPISFRSLIQQGANINLQDKKGFSALHVAALRGEYQFAEILLKHGARTDLQDIFGNNPLFRVKHDQTALIQLLLDYGCDPYHKNRAGNSAYDMLSLYSESKGLFPENAIEKT